MEAKLRRVLREEISRLKDHSIAPEEILDDEWLFNFPDRPQSRIDLDSLDALELAFSIEQELGIEQPLDVDYMQLTSINQIVAFVATLLPEQA